MAWYEFWNWFELEHGYPWRVQEGTNGADSSGGATLSPLMACQVETPFTGTAAMIA
jgi:hypothetical protein